jgi:voltage-gated potassium channel Kch
MPFLGLFAFTLAIFVLQAITSSVVIRQLVIVIYLYAVWLALSASGAGSPLRVLLLALWAATVLLRVVPIAGPELAFRTASRLSGALLLVICVLSIGRFVLLSGRLTIDTLFAAAVVYVLMASAFGQAYTALHVLIPDAFVVPPYLAGQLTTNPDQLFNYFSFVTLTTLGYGDIVPRDPVAQVLVYVEAVLGQLYVAVVVAWLVGHVIAARSGRPPDRPSP